MTVANHELSRLIRFISRFTAHSWKKFYLIFLISGQSCEQFHPPPLRKPSKARWTAAFNLLPIKGTLWKHAAENRMHEQLGQNNGRRLNLLCHTWSQASLKSLSCMLAESLKPRLGACVCSAAVFVYIVCCVSVTLSFWTRRNVRAFLELAWETVCSSYWSRNGSVLLGYLRPTPLYYFILYFTASFEKFLLLYFFLSNHSSISNPLYTIPHSLIIYLLFLNF